MRLKSYFAGTVEAAIALARQELGPDAMLVSSRRATPDTRYLGDYEVVFALAPKSPDDAPGEPTKTEKHAAATSSRDEMVAHLSADIAQLKRQIETLAGAVAQSQSEKNAIANAVNPGSSRMRMALRDADVDPEVADEIAARLGGDGGSARSVLDSALLDFVCVDSTLGRPGSERKIVALVGPPGAGKTSTLVKLAVTYGVAARRPVHIISTDVFRIAAAEQLRAYATILGLGFESVETGFALAQALEDRRPKELVLIDTPGLAGSELGDAAELAEFLSSHADIDVHLVIPTSMRRSDMERILARYSLFGPDKLIFTKIDETDCWGPLISLPRNTGRPVSFLTGGQQIPEDLEAATAERIAELVFGPILESEQTTCAIA
jgi:flagellar biosynthesis protein FlhF